jgi:hypothetical protein
VRRAQIELVEIIQEIVKGLADAGLVVDDHYAWAHGCVSPVAGSSGPGITAVPRAKTTQLNCMTFSNP